MVAVRAWPRRLLGGALAVTGAAVVLGCGWAVFGAGGRAGGGRSRPAPAAG